MRASRIVIIIFLLIVLIVLWRYEKNMPLRLSDFAGSPKFTKSLLENIESAAEEDAYFREWAKSDEGKQELARQKGLAHPGTNRGPGVPADKRFARQDYIELEFEAGSFTKRKHSGLMRHVFSKSPIDMQVAAHTLSLTDYPIPEKDHFDQCDGDAYWGYLPIEKSRQIPFCACKQQNKFSILFPNTVKVVHIPPFMSHAPPNRDTRNKPSFTLNQSHFIIETQFNTGSRPITGTIGYEFIWDPDGNPLQIQYTSFGFFSGHMVLDLNRIVNDANPSLTFLALDTNSNGLISDEELIVSIQDITKSDAFNNKEPQRIRPGDSIQFEDKSFQLMSIKP